MLFQTYLQGYTFIFYYFMLLQLNSKEGQIFSERKHYPQSYFQLSSHNRTNNGVELVEVASGRSTTNCSLLARNLHGMWPQSGVNG